MPGLTLFLVTPPRSFDKNQPVPVTVAADNVHTLQQAQTLKDTVKRFLKKECGRRELKKLLE